ncbi:hypothetical protein [Micropruina sp.]|uniref:hypothetical protein n=1 Tax=Micropruina sp. TaxID=2737536 RepID=UPI0039E67A1B
MPLRPCIDCGKPTAGRRCRTHQATYERGRTPRPTNLTRDPDERDRRAAAVAAHRATHGEWCPGWNTRAAHDVHPPNILTADHDTAVANGGDPNGPLIVRCRVCNGAKSNR